MLLHVEASLKGMTKKFYPVSAIIKAHEVLEYISSRSEATFTEIYTDLKRPKSSTYKIISTLETLGYIRSVGDGGRYSLGTKLLELGARAGSQYDLVTEARPLVKRLSMETQRTCHVGILDKNDVVYVVKENTHCLIRIDTWVGKRIGVYCTALGKALLAWRNEWEVKAILDDVEFEKVAPNTITDKEKFLQILPEIKERGWALDDEESVKMVRCVAAPIFDQKGDVCAALSVSTITELDNYEEMLNITNKVVRCARELSEKMGARKEFHNFSVLNN